MRSWNELKYMSLLDLWEGVMGLFRRPKNEVVYDICCENPEEAMLRNAMLSMKTGKAVVGEVSEDGRKLTSTIRD